MIPNRPPDLVLPGGNVWILNPEALPQAQKNLVQTAYKMWREGRFQSKADREADKAAQKGTPHEN